MSNLQGTTKSQAIAIGSLPPEIILDILKHLPRPANWENPKKDEWGIMQTLYACSLVSREWNSLTLSLVFQDIVWTPRGCPRSFPVSSAPNLFDLDDYVQDHATEYVWPYGTANMPLVAPPDERPKERRIKQVVQPSRHADSTLASLAGFLDSSPSVCAHVRRLRLDFMKRGTGELQKGNIASLMSVLKSLPRLRVLHIHGFTDRSASPRASDVQGLSLTRLRISFYSNTYYENYREAGPSTVFFFFIHDITTLLSYFDRVDELEIVPGRSLASLRTISNTIPCPVVKTLVLTQPPSEVGVAMQTSRVYDHFAQSPLLDSVRCLITNQWHSNERDPNRGDDEQRLHALCAASSIEELRYDLWSGHDGPLPVDVTRYTKLKKLSLRIHFHSSTSASDPSFQPRRVLQCATEFFARCGPGLEVITLVIRFHQSFIPDVKDSCFGRCSAQWDALDRQMAKLLDAGSVKRVDIQFAFKSSDMRLRHSHEDEISVRILGMLPCTDGPGRLTAQYVTDKIWVSTIPDVVWN